MPRLTRSKISMNEPPNPSDPKPPAPSDATPPPPPPPPFTPPPASPEPPVPPPAPTPPRAPVYTPPPAGPAKKSATPWVLGGCGCLTLIIIIVAVVCFLASRAKQKVVEFKSDFKSALKEVDQTSQALTNPRAMSETSPR